MVRVAQGQLSLQAVGGRLQSSRDEGDLAKTGVLSHRLTLLLGFTGPHLIHQLVVVSVDGVTLVCIAFSVLRPRPRVRSMGYAIAQPTSSDDAQGLAKRPRSDRYLHGRGEPDS
jgi:hypothetical protein